MARRHRYWIVGTQSWQQGDSGEPFMLKMLKGKIHRARVTGADLDYEGSVTIDETLLERAGILPHEAVQIWNITNGERFETYAVAGAAGSGVVCVNGAAAHRVSAGDLIIIAAFAYMDEKKAQVWEPQLVFVDERNRAVDAGRTEIPGPERSPRHSSTL